MDNPYYEKLVNAALRYISFRPRSQKELTDFLARKLTRWNVSGNLLITRVTDRMRELGYVNDEAFAAWWIGQRSDFRQKGQRFIAHELSQKGVSKAVIDRAFSQLHAGGAVFDEEESARNALKKKLARWAKLPSIEQKKKMYAFLAGRGFSAEIARRIIDEALGKE